MCRKLKYLVSFVLVLWLALTSTADAADLNLVGWWRFDEGSGNIAYDSSDYGRDGTLVGDPQWVAGRIGGALEFDGTDDYVGTGESFLDNMSEFTLACWVAAGNPGNSRIGLVGQNDLIEMGFMNGNAEIWTSATGTTTTAWTFEDYTWHYITITGDATSMKIYLDGELAATGGGTVNYGTSTFPVNIGGGGVWDAGANWFLGKIDDVRIYNHALSEIEILIAMSGGKWPYALGPEPADGALHLDTWVNLCWTTGGLAVSHDVYFSDNFDDVNAGGEDAFQGNQPSAFFVVGFPGFPYSDGLVPGTTYYWRVDEVNDTEPNSPWKGNVWSFTVPPRIAYDPNPADGIDFINPNVNLSWTSGFCAKLHHVYLGNDFANVNDADTSDTTGIYRCVQEVTTYTPGPLEFDKVYYWRVDEFDGSATYKGDVWSFSTQKEGKQWLKDAKYGVFVHYLGSGPNWNDIVNFFDVETFAGQIGQTGVGYLIFTLGQNSGYYCSLNETYNQYAGYKEGERCSRRDLPMEIAEALGKRGIRLILYLPSRSPQLDEKTMAGLGDVHERQPAPQGFTRRWSEVIREWSERYGTRISGWWFDGAYNTEGWDDLSMPYNWNTWAAAARAGNPDSILAFNAGQKIEEAFQSLTEQQDYTAGEQNSFGATPKKNSAPVSLQWHILSYLGVRWGNASGPRKNDEWMIQYIKEVNEQGGVVTMDVSVAADGTVYEAHLKQLNTIGKGIRFGAVDFNGDGKIAPDPLSEALDTALSFTTGGSADWFSQTTTSRYDGDAARSGDISHSQDSWMQTTLSGKGTVKFYWKVSSEEDFDFLEFYIDGSLQDRISGLVNWEHKTYSISTSGSHTLEWRYVKDGSVGFGSDCGWVDKVEWVTN